MDIEERDISEQYFDSLPPEFGEWEQAAFNTFPEKFESCDYDVSHITQMHTWWERIRKPKNTGNQTALSFAQNSPTALISSVGRALNEDTAKEKADTLTDLSGVNVSVASTFLTFIYPHSHIIYDTTTLIGLTDLGILDEHELPSVAKSKRYSDIIEASLSLANSSGVSLRALNRAFWLHSHDRNYSLTQ